MFHPSLNKKSERRLSLMVSVQFELSASNPTTSSFSKPASGYQNAILQITYSKLETNLVYRGAPVSISNTGAKGPGIHLSWQNLVDMTSIWHSLLPHKTFRKSTYHINKHEVMHSCGTYDYQTNYELCNKLTQAKKSHPYTVWLFARMLYVATKKHESKCHKNKQVTSLALAWFQEQLPW